MAASQPHPWLRGPVEGVPAQLQPVAHALIQTREEVHEFTRDFPDELLWERPAGLAPVGFHLRHIAGVISRLFATAEHGEVGEELRRALQVERRLEDVGVSTRNLVDRVDEAVEIALDQLRRTESGSLGQARQVGSKRLPTTVMGALFHAAEHAQRHCGQLLVTTRVVLENRQP